jgi:hypothetical protein
MNYPVETDEMASLRDEIVRNCRRISTLANDIELEFIAQFGDPWWEIGNARELLDTIETQISDYEKLNIMNERLGGIGV